MIISSDGYLVFFIHQTMIDCSLSTECHLTLPSVPQSFSISTPLLSQAQGSSIIWDKFEVLLGIGVQKISGTL